MSVCGIRFVRTLWYSTMPWEMAPFGVHEAEIWWEFSWSVCVCVFTHTLCKHFAMVCFMEPLHYWLLGWVHLIQRWEVESHRGKKDFPRPENHGPFRMSITLLFLSQKLMGIVKDASGERRAPGESWEPAAVSWVFLTCTWTINIWNMFLFISFSLSLTFFQNQ